MTRKDLVLLFLQASPGRPIKGRSLAEMVGTNERNVRDDISALRKDGQPIASGDQGYWIGGPDELLRCSRRLRAHAIKEMQDASRMMWAARKAYQATLEEAEGA